MRIISAMTSYTVIYTNTASPVPKWFIIAAVLGSLVLAAAIVVLIVMLSRRQ